MTLPGAPRPLGFLPPTPSTNSPFSTTRWDSSTMSRMASSKVSATPLDAPRRPESVQTGVDQRRGESDTRGKRPAGEWGWGVATGPGGAHSGTPEAEAATWRERERDGVDEMLIDEWRPRFAARQANVQLSSRASQSYEHRQYDPETRARADSTFSRLLPHLSRQPPSPAPDTPPTTQASSEHSAAGNTLRIHPAASEESWAAERRGRGRASQQEDYLLRTR